MAGFKCIQVFVALSFTPIAVSAQAAQIRTSVADGVNFVSINGIIQEGDDRTFNGLTAVLPAGSVVVLASQGGSVVPALGIGRAIRLKAFTTVAASNSLCASAWALTSLAGMPRFMSTNSHIGFHAAYRVLDGKSAGESGVNTKARYCWA